MGIDNRQRRKAKQKARRARTAPRTAARPLFERADDLAVSAFAALAKGDERGYARAVERLAGEPAAGRALFTRRDDYLATLWRDGWQPAELHRFVRRQGDAVQAALALDGMAAEIRGYATATVDERWQAQLDDLGATVWWQDDDGYLDEVTGGSGRTNMIDSWLRMLDVLASAPPLPRLLPPPGEGRRGSLGGRRREVDQRMLEKVRGLLAKAESTTYEAEAATYTAKAQELMTRHSIDYALLAVRAGAKEEPVARRIAVDGPYELEKVDLLAAIARANRARSVWTRSLGLVTVVGFPADLDAIEVLFTSLLVQATRAMTEAGRQRDAAGRSRTRSFRQSFLTGFALRIGERLRQASRTATEAAGDSGALLPVLASRETQLDQALAEMFGGRLHYQPGALPNNAHGFNSGIAAAERASLHRGEALP